ncbi:tRNA (adenosine(37)-N6)-dimethylallyltransferase MiaA [Fibrobacter sp. UWB5]|uniref:tRNA (adenosine(37)-N6)-dimethylallyltransferase MiaA n=1 Tax=Fibrobacter sp. UWB5 TaxID=1964360 RepID=UPI000B523CE4|nr:tRNA (adenosine(37)-N6)-dimethylallyltransferase MiaA [Fibrobacter sp. UWB5]OWV12152.1 tRNA (adenosine(37)-N6)-dimethylallyltransferase MiaA [Fibrobacter sp. UWB5]
MPIVFALVGATGIGKSELSLRLAESFNAEIIGVDSRQVYKGFSIGTAQPDTASLKRVKHHLVNFLPPTETFSAGEFCRQVKHLLAENPDKKYILVGGTGLYVQSLLLGLPNIPAVPPSVRKKFEDMAACEGSASLYKMACEVDPESAANVDPNNAQRLVRILEVFEATGRPLSGYQKEREGGIGAVPVFWLQRERDVLYKRIDARVDQMIKEGWVEEVQELSQTVPLTAPAWQSLGYRELLQAKSASEMAGVIEEVKKKTRNYAKRQLTWFRGQMNCSSIDMNEDPFKAIMDLLQ